MEKTSFWHKLFGTTPGKGVQPKEAIAYSITGFGQNFICTIIGSYITVFMTEALLFGSKDFYVGAVPGAVAVALLLLFTRVFDAMNDPIMGSIVDRTRTPWGKCRPYLKWMAIPIGAMTIVCFFPGFQAKSTTSFAIIFFMLFGQWFIPLPMFLTGRFRQTLQTTPRSGVKSSPLQGLYAHSAQGLLPLPFRL